jgi:hypothetical protein
MLKKRLETRHALKSVTSTRKAPGMWKHAYGNVNQAAARVNYLNGGTGELQMRG